MQASKGGPMPFLVERIVESLFIILISAVPAYVLIKIGIIHQTVLSYIIVFCAEALIFYLLNIPVLINYHNYVSIKHLYYKVNYILLAVQAIISLAALLFLQSGEVFTIVFGYTKFLRPFGVSKELSLAIFWMLYAAEIALIGIFHTPTTENQVMEDEALDEQDTNNDMITDYEGDDEKDENSEIYEAVVMSSDS